MKVHSKYDIEKAFFGLVDELFGTEDEVVEHMTTIAERLLGYKPDSDWEPAARHLVKSEEVEDDDPNELLQFGDAYYYLDDSWAATREWMRIHVDEQDGINKPNQFIFTNIRDAEEATIMYLEENPHYNIRILDLWKTVDLIQPAYCFDVLDPDGETFGYLGAGPDEVGFDNPFIASYSPDLDMFNNEAFPYLDDQLIELEESGAIAPADPDADIFGNPIDGQE